MDIQHRLTAAEAGTAELTDDDARKIVGEDLASRQTAFTHLILDHCKKDESFYLDLANKMHATLRKIFGHGHFFGKVHIIAIDSKNPLSRE